MGRMRNKDLMKGVDVMEAARVIFHVTEGARVPWAHGLLDDDACLEAIRKGVDLVFGGIAAPDTTAPGAAPQRETGAPAPSLR